MASSTSFKQECPSCEAMVPITNPGLIGRKIDCPKCKYRFVVKEPEDDEEEKKPAAKKKDEKSKPAPAKGGPRGKSRKDDDADDAPKPKKKGGGDNTVLLGGALAGVAVVAIVVGAIMFWPSGDSKPSGGTPGGGMATGGGPGMPGTNPDGGGTGQPKEKGPDKPTSVLVNASNLLPNDAQTVYCYPMGSALSSAFREAASTGGFVQDRFEQRTGIALDDVHRIVSAGSQKDDWVFTLVQTTTPYKQDQVKARLALGVAVSVRGKSGKNHDYFPVGGELDSLGVLLVQQGKPRPNLSVHFHDNNTLVFADPAPLAKFLELDGKPEFLTKDAPAGGGTEAPANPGSGGMLGGMPAMMGGGPGAMGGGPSIGKPTGAGVGSASGGGPSAGPGGGVPPMAGGGPGMGGSPIGGMPGGPGGGLGGTSPPASEVVTPSSFMTVDPALKRILDQVGRLEENKTTKRREPSYIVAMASLMEPLQASLRKSINGPTKDLPFLKAVFEGKGIDALTLTAVRLWATAEVGKLRAV